MKSERITDNESIGRDLTKDLHATFLESMEVRYKEILTFFGFVLPAFTGFAWLPIKYKEAEDKSALTQVFIVGTAFVITVLFWGAVYALAASYRYRYLQASVYLIEDRCNVARYIPKSFKPKHVKGLKARLLFSFVPGILQVHVFFLLISTGLVVFTSWWLVDWSLDGIVPFGVWILGLALFCFLGFFYYPNKINRIIEDLDKRGANLLLKKEE